MDLALANRQRIEKLPCIAHAPENLETLLDAGSFRERLHLEISQAKQRIYLVALYLQDDAAGRDILTSLYQAKQANPDLDIRVLVDWHRAQRGLIGANKSDGNAAFYREYAEAYKHQIEVLGVPVKNREVFGVLHLKGFIVDDRVIYSGASLNDVYLAQQDRYRYDRYHVLQNKALADTMSAFIVDTLTDSDAVNCLNKQVRPTTKALKGAIKNLRSQLQSASYHFDNQSISANQVGLTPLIGLGKRKNRLNKHICTLLASAQKELTICTPYFNFPRLVSKEIKLALKRGVKINIIVGDKTANDFFIPPSEPFKTIAGLPYLYEVNLRKFAKQNESAINKGQLSLNLWCHDNNSFHLKGIWVDQQYMMITGNNLNPRAWKLDLENAILVHDKNQLLAEQNEKELACIMQHCTRVNSYLMIDNVNSYPNEVKKLIKRIHRTKVDHILKQIL
ncbi:CDP-diacylglycerol--serine O-phosphatidyltransferase [Marinomonas sp. PE14-40]|uniref:CDP-diacylglycerol--serine O-phosphatidyltransferase n=1 Tax=Marinomonas sp. PE14-40 TaxID=3060621 RepID=UPI003F670A5D